MIYEEGLKLVEALCQDVTAKDLPVEREKLCLAIEHRVRCALPSLQQHQLAFMWMQPCQFSPSHPNGADTSGGVTAHKYELPEIYAAQRLRRFPGHRMAVVAIEWGQHSVTTDVQQVMESMPAQILAGGNDHGLALRLSAVMCRYARDAHCWFYSQPSALGKNCMWLLSD
jgi:hypothetical protein